MILSTYSVKPIEFKAVDSQEPGSKPLGLWFAPEEKDYWGDEDSEVENAWKTWCEQEHYAPYAYNHKYMLHRIPFCSLQQMDPQKVLHLSTVKEIKDFNYLYGIDEYRVDWNTLATKVAGIFIQPYQHELRHYPLTRWYYGWDLSSGCIWRLPEGTTLEEVELDWDSSGLVPTKRYL